MKKGDNGFGNSTIFDYQTGFPRPQSVVGFDWPLYESRKKALDRKKAEVAAVEKWINAIEEGQTRCVFRMFYMDGMSWDKVAAKTGYIGNPDYPRLYIRDKYLKKNGDTVKKYRLYRKYRFIIKINQKAEAPTEFSFPVATAGCQSSAVD